MGSSFMNIRCARWREAHRGKTLTDKIVTVKRLHGHDTKLDHCRVGNADMI
jgi:hypothetical protein